VSGTERKVFLLRSVLLVVLFPSRNSLESLDGFSHSCLCCINEYKQAVSNSGH